MSKNKQTILQDIGFSGFRFDCIIGVYPEERTEPQPLIVDLWVRYNAFQAIQSDSEKYALDYTVLAEQIKKIATEGKFGLLETLACRSAEFLLDTHSEILEISLEIRKPRGLPDSEGSRVRYSVVGKKEQSEI